MKRLFVEHWITFVGVLVGAVGGYLYWYLVGCTTDACPLQSSPLYMVLWGAAVGGLAFNILKNLFVNNN